MLNDFICTCHIKRFESAKKLKKHIYDFKNREKSLLWIKNNPEKVKLSWSKYISKLENKTNHLTNNKKYRDNLSVEMKERNRIKRQEYWQEYKVKNNIRAKERYKKDICFKLRHAIMHRVNNALKGKIKLEGTYSLLSCSIEDFKKYLEGKFKARMSWENYGYYGWHIDHIRPCASFNLDISEEQKKCFHYTNLQPLWRVENQEKGSNYGY